MPDVPNRLSLAGNARTQRPSPRDHPVLPRPASMRGQMPILRPSARPLPRRDASMMIILCFESKTGLICQNSNITRYQGTFSCWVRRDCSLSPRPLKWAPNRPARWKRSRARPSPRPPRSAADSRAGILSDVRRGSWTAGRSIPQGARPRRAAFGHGRCRANCRLVLSGQDQRRFITLFFSKR
jgi:hypothetical protein